MKYNIPVYKPWLNGNEKKYVNECLDSTWISSKGEFIQRFEESFADYVGVKYAASVCNGTVALHLALISLGIGPGDEVIVPTLTYIASVNAIIYTGATPIFVDSKPDTWQLDSADFEKKITSRTKAVIVVHLYGHPCDMDSIQLVTKKNNIFLVEDCAEAIGSEYKGRKVGSFGDVATFSFFGNKTITCGEGGMVVTNDQTIHERNLNYKGQGLAKYREYWHDVVGYNYRMTNIAAAIGLAQLEQIQIILERKIKIANLYLQGFENSGVILHSSSDDVLHTYWMCSILLSDQKLRDIVRKELALGGVETRPVFYPVHTMPMHATKFQRHVIAEDIGWRGINLPSYPELTADEISYIVKIVKGCL
jgi:perosamine synthetase